MNEEPTIPPRRPNTIRTFLARGMEWAKAHPEHALRGVVFLAGVLIGKFLL